MRIIRQRLVKTYWSIGSNQGNREHYFAQARRHFEQVAALEVIAVSPIYETEPVGFSRQPAFLNAALEIGTTLEPLELLEIAQQIEKELGRKRDIVWGPRTIDLDLLLYGDRQITSEKLVVPHPRMHERKFVLVPLAQLIPEQVVPVHRDKVRTLLERCRDRSRVTPYKPLQIDWEYTKMES